MFLLNFLYQNEIKRKQVKLNVFKTIIVIAAVKSFFLFLTFNCRTDDASFKNDFFIFTCSVFISCFRFIMANENIHFSNSVSSFIASIL